MTTTRSGTAALTAASTVLLLATLGLFARGLVVVLTGPSAGNPTVSWTVASTALVLLPAFVGTAARADAIRRALGVPPVSTGVGVSSPALLAGGVGLAAVAVVFESLAAGLPVAHVAAALAGAVGVGAVGWILGARSGADAAELRDGLRDGVPFPADVPWDRRAVLLRVAGIAGAAVAAIVVAAAVQAPAADPTAPILLGAGVLSVGAAGIVAGIVSMLVVQADGRVLLPLLLDLDAATRKAVLRRIRGRGAPLEPDLEWRAARIARASRIGEAFSSAGMALMVMGASAVVLGAASWASPDTARVLTAGAVGLAFVGMSAMGLLGVAYGMLLVHSSGDAVVALAASPRPGAVDADRWPAPTGAPLG